MSCKQTEVQTRVICIKQFDKPLYDFNQIGLLNLLVTHIIVEQERQHIEQERQTRRVNKETRVSMK